MRALVVEGPGAAAVRDVPEPVPGPGEVLVEVAAAGICGSDLELLDGRRPAAYVRYPVVPGHEWAGRVLSVGPEVRDLAPGDPVVAEGLRSCGVCDRCGEGRTNLCTAGYAETGFTLPGALAERLAVPARLVHRLPPDRPLEPAALLEPAACVASALLEAGMPLPGARVAVVGDGPLGLLALLLLRTVTPAELVLVGARPARSAFGAGCGATRVVAATDQAGLDGLAGRFDAVVEATNDPVRGGHRPWPAPPGRDRGAARHLRRRAAGDRPGHGDAQPAPRPGRLRRLEGRLALGHRAVRLRHPRPRRRW